MRFRVIRLLAASLALLSPLSAEDNRLEWTDLPAIPDAEGFAGSFSGVSDGSLVVAGGANFPSGRPWEGGEKVWYDKVFLLSSPDGNWVEAGKLPRPLGYGVSISTDKGLVCIGGSDATQHYDGVFRIRKEGDGLLIDELPPLPMACANMSGALLGSSIYVAGGTASPKSVEALHTFWRLDLEDLESGWQDLDPWPGSARFFAAAGVQDGSFILAGGAGLESGDDNAASRIFLKDAYRFTPSKGWKRIADLPRISVAAPNPMPTTGSSGLLLFGGDDGSQIDVAPDQHVGFPKDILAYHTITDTWNHYGEMEAALVTTNIVDWEGCLVIPGGEIRPGVRSPRALATKLTSQQTASFGVWNYVTLCTYLLVMVLIGWWFSRQKQDAATYFKGGGNMPWWAAGISIFATTLSSLTFMSVPAKAYSSDWTFLWANLPILLIAPFVIAVYLPFFRRLQITSAYEYLEKRFNLGARLYGGAAFVLFQLGRQAIVLLLPSLALATVSNIDVRFCIILMGALCVAYTVMGGISAVIWTDVCQTVVLLGAGILTLVIIVSGLDGGIGEFFETAKQADKFHSINWTLDPHTAANAFWVIIVGNLFINLIPYTSDQTVVQRYMTTSDEKQAARSIWINAALAIPATLMFFLIGTALYVFYRNHPERIDSSLSTDTIFPAFIIAKLPVGIAGIVIAGIFAAAQSTVSSSINSVAAVLTTDYWQRLNWPGRGKDGGLKLAKVLTAVVGIFATLAALLLAELQLKSLWDGYNSLIGLAASGLAGLFALGIFTKRANGAGALIGAGSSAVVLYLVQKHTDLHFFLYAGIGIISCVTIGWLASWFFPAPNQSLNGLTLSQSNRKQTP